MASKETDRTSHFELQENVSAAWSKRGPTRPMGVCGKAKGGRAGMDGN